MLVLSRHTGEVIEIGDDIKIMAIAICGDKVRLGIDAPREVSVHRGEIADLIRLQKNAEGTESP